jgi:hypothetical protein
MLQKLAYFNLIAAIIYLLAYLKSGTFNSTAGIFMVILFNWLSLRSYELDRYDWKIWHYLTGLWSLYFIGTTGYGTVNILSNAVEYDFIDNDTLIFSIASIIFCLAVIWHFLYYLKVSRSAKE